MPFTQPGYFGKVPARGDFIGCRTAGAAWDAWLSRFTTIVCQSARDQLPEAWFTAPLWRFALGAGALEPMGLAGVLVASADRVGRLFPFTIFAPTNGIPAPEWYVKVEELVLDALDDGFEPETLNAALLCLGPPPPHTPMAPGQTWWWTDGSDRLAPTELMLVGLPEGRAAAAMVLGPPD